MKIEIKVPSVGESVGEAVLAEWFKENGDIVEKDEALFVLETDKVTLEVVAQEGGQLEILVQAGQTVQVGVVVGTIDTQVQKAAHAKRDEVKVKDSPPQREPDTEKVAKPETESTPLPQKESMPAEKRKKTEAFGPMGLPPSVRKLVKEKNVDISKIAGTGPAGRITKGDVILYLEQSEAVDRGALTVDRPDQQDRDKVSRKPMTPIRRRIADRLLAAKQNTAMLTTFNEIDMSRVMQIRSAYKEEFLKKHGVRLGFMSLFTKACVEALKDFPDINAYIDGTDMVYHNYYHIGIAIGTARGLVVPIIRNADKLSLAQLEKTIVDYVEKINNNRLEISDLEGGTFTITNGGVYGSLLSTPILNMPQSGILGMHKIEQRPIVVDGQIVIRPMMYVALSYDHRIVDGQAAVTFLVRIKSNIENPERMLMEL